MSNMSKCPPGCPCCSPRCPPPDVIKNNYVDLVNQINMYKLFQDDYEPHLDNMGYEQPRLIKFLEVVKFINNLDYDQGGGLGVRGRGLGGTMPYDKVKYGYNR